MYSPNMNEQLVSPVSDSNVDYNNLQYILSIDIGIYHLGLVLIGCDVSYTTHRVLWFELVDITSCLCKSDEHPMCTLYHSNYIADRMAHVFQKYNDVFDGAHTILIEQQPPQGLTAVEQLILFKYRSKAVMVHPSSVHKWMNWKYLNYEQRKIESIRIFEQQLETQELIYMLDRYERKHDLADAYCMCRLFIHRQYITHKYNAPTEVDPVKRGYCIFLEQFRYKPCLTIPY